jgi:TPR repeat protein
LGLLLVERGQLAEAETWYRAAIAAGDVDAIVNMAHLLSYAGRGDEAEQLLRVAAERGNVTALGKLATLMDSRGRADEAEVFYRQGAQAGGPVAQCALAVFLRDRALLEDNSARVEDNSARVEDNNAHLVGAHLVAAHLVEGRLAEAERWFRLAANAGDAKARNHLGHLLAGRGDTEGAQRVLQQALAAGQLPAVLQLSRLLESTATER